MYIILSRSLSQSTDLFINNFIVHLFHRWRLADREMYIEWHMHCPIPLKENMCFIVERFVNIQSTTTNMCIRLTSFIMSITSLEIIAESSPITRGLCNQKRERESLNDQKQTFSLRGWLLFIFDRTGSSAICADHLSLNCFASSRGDKESSEEKKE